MTMNSSGHPPIPPIVPRRDDDGAEGVDNLEPFDDDDAPVDPDADPNQVDSAEADVRASTEGTKDGDLDLER
jgi:hypothetical protein